MHAWIVAFDPFQFLIGILKTQAILLYAAWGYRFQFLIGILKTHPPTPNSLPAQDFSIPYRYSKNHF